ncbi:unnamed protein product [Thelazia callipaeda]|uniref:SWI5-dependent HO expression protein 3 n=1 Tax=Thelazia callipaeda TaxID=103827 RepID=A0A158RCX7_THECL|nr:unnamed protein product [Thelazia callipaeda]
MTDAPMADDSDSIYPSKPPNLFEVAQSSIVAAKEDPAFMQKEMEYNTHIKSLEKLIQELQSKQTQKKKLARNDQELSALDKEKALLQLEYSSALNDIQRLKDDIRPTVNFRTELERRFEECRYRLSCALETIHEYEDEVLMLKSRAAEYESKSQESNCLTNHNDNSKKGLDQIYEYTEQLEKQFAEQVEIIEALKQKIMQSMKTNGNLSFPKIEDELAKFRSSQLEEGNCLLVDAIQTLLRLLSDSTDYDHEMIPNSDLS